MVIQPIEDNPRYFNNMCSRGMNSTMICFIGQQRGHISTNCPNPRVHVHILGIVNKMATQLRSAVLLCKLNQGVMMGMQKGKIYPNWL
jgi:hypothetical protein